ncbi:tetratricopeptide repeat protein [Streptomyces sp. NBC_01551]|uniref:CHAT domain-containing tetratricopeptide repeat protein n=1 Tax=Streptomyces sp. NBC_01551 TaxID=2975876 RepID=UPI002253747C|nr:tetratricopeptide repeat protein [Streptomyces sp. NBC_01551]MCX4529285.1 tetratricopeptide repeat protein [Streptomyces sp. NBC_01551]
MAAVQARLLQAEDAQDLSLLLDPAALVEAQRLTRLLDDQDVEGRCSLGWLHWQRYRASPEGRDQEDLNTALTMFTFCFVHDISDDALPEPLLPSLADAAVATAIAMHRRVVDSPEPAVVDATIRVWQHILIYTPADHPGCAVYLNNLGLALRARFERLGAVADLDAAIDAGRKAVEATPTDHPKRAGRLINLVLVLRARFERLGVVADLDAAIKAGREAVEAAPAGHPNRATALSNLGNALGARFRRLGAVADLDAAIDAFREAVEATPTDHPDRAGYLSNLGNALGAYFEGSGVVADLDAAIKAGREAVEAAPAGHPNRATALSNLGNALGARFERSGAVTDLDAAVDVSREAVEATPAGHPNRAGYLSNLGNALRARFERLGAVADLDAAVDVSREAVEATPAGHPDRAMNLSKLGSALRFRFERSGAVTDLDAAVDVSREAVEATPAGHPDRAGYLSNLGNALVARYKRSGVVVDLNASTDAFREAVEATPAGHPDRADYLSNLGIALRIRFEGSGVVADLDAAVKSGREAVEATPACHPDRADYLSNLVLALRARFERLGTVTDLDTAINAGREALEATPVGHPNRAAYLTNLGGALVARFKRLGAVADMDAAIDAGRKAVEATPTDHPNRAMHLSNLGNALAVRFGRLGAVADLDAAIDAFREAVEATPAGHHNRAGYLSNLGTVLGARSGMLGAVADLDAAIDAGREAVEAAPVGHHKRAMYLNNLGIALIVRFEQLGAVADLDAAIQAGREAVEATPTDHPDRAMHLNNLGNALAVRFKRSGAVTDLDAAVRALVMATEVGSAAPSVRVSAGRAAGGLLASSDPGRAAGLLEGAVRLLPEVAPRGLDRPDQQELLGGLAGLAGDAAALVLADLSAPVDERAGRALGLLESGRVLLLAQVMATRGDLTDLRALHPDLAERFTELRDLLDQPPSSSVWFATADTGSGPEQAMEARDRRRVAAELDLVLEQIRGLKGFASFALPPTVDDLRGQAGQGPVVTFNVNDHRSDALLLTEQGVTIVALPDLTPAVVIDRIEAFHQALADSSDSDPDADRAGAQQRVREILAWLWDTAVGPVLDALGYTGPPADGQEWPRLWWASGGLLSLLPLHAAGHHTPRDDPGHQARTVLDRVVSSYTPTIGALRYARQHTALPPKRAQTLIVAMPSTPGLERQGRLPAVTHEAALLQARLPQPILLTEPDTDTGTTGAGDHTPTKAAVFTHLAEITIAHFACHGESHPTDPSQSRLLLHDWQQDPLTVASLTPVNLDYARLAYLSACSTALTRNPQLLDESIHLTAAFQLAGFPHVIGTLWEINDKHSADIADAFYTRLTDSEKNVDTVRAAHALHATIRSLRDQLPLTPSLWAAHLHAGA